MVFTMLGQWLRFKHGAELFWQKGKLILRCKPTHWYIYIRKAKVMLIPNTFSVPVSQVILSVPKHFKIFIFFYNLSFLFFVGLFFFIWAERAEKELLPELCSCKIVHFICHMLLTEERGRVWTTQGHRAIRDTALRVSMMMYDVSIRFYFSCGTKLWQNCTAFYSSTFLYIGSLLHGVNSKCACVIARGRQADMSGLN